MKATIMMIAVGLMSCGERKLSEGQLCAKPDDCGLALTCIDLVCVSAETMVKAAHCMTAAECKDYGRCTAKAGECVVTSDIDCAQAEFVCKTLGKCTAKNGECVAASDVDCQRSERCARFGRCVADAGRCIATSADCARLGMCATDGVCTVINGECVKK